MPSLLEDTWVIQPQHAEHAEPQLYFAAMIPDGPAPTTATVLARRAIVSGPMAYVIAMARQSGKTRWKQ